MVTIAGVQYTGHIEKEVNVETAARLVREAAARGAQIICLPELCNTSYFCTEERPTYFDLAEPIPGPTVERMATIARDTGTVVIVPLFERAADGHFYNSAAVVGPDGQVIGRYRKASIPFMDRRRSPEPRGNEKYYFTPGNLGFPVFTTPWATIGILICYDRHFPEAARILGLRGAEIVFVPTCTSSMTRYLWDLELRAHAVMNIYYVCGVNRVGVDIGGSTRQHFGCTLIATPRGEIIAQGSDEHEDVVVATLDLAILPELRELWGYYRDRRPDLYGPLVEPVSCPD